MRRPSTALFAGGVLTAALASACGSGGGYGSSSAATAPASPAASADATSPAAGAGGYQAPPPAVAAVAVGLRKGAVGTFLVDGSGRTLYLFEADKANASSCTSTCTQAWPPLTTMAAAATAGQGVNDALLGVVKRSDGTSQVSYGGHPLYFYADDTAAGQVHGQGVTEFGAKWYVVSPAGQNIDKD
jgi:predicted lipoprotein with Yx(FWY)xxD motif